MALDSPFLQQLGSALLAGLIAPIVYLSLRTIKPSPQPSPLVDAKKENLPLVIVILAEFVIISLWFVFVAPTLPTRPRVGLVLLDYNEVTTSRVAVFYALHLLPLVIAMKWTRQSPASIGIVRESRLRVLSLGPAWGGISIVATGLIGLGLNLGLTFVGLSPTLAYGLVTYTIVGFSEELIWRGYVQTRIIAYAGPVKGVVIVSLLFALWHFPSRYYTGSGDVLLSLTTSLLVLPLGLLFGYMMLRTQNILVSSLSHSIADWNLAIFRLPIS